MKLVLGLLLLCFSAQVLARPLGTTMLNISKRTMVVYLKEFLAIPGDYYSFCHKVGDVFDESCYCLYQNRMHPSVLIMKSYFQRAKEKGIRPTFQNYERDVIFNYAFKIAPVLEKRLISPESYVPSPSDRREIPRIIHKFWITNPLSPHPIPDQYVEILKNDTVNLSSDWKIVIWVWDEQSLSENLKQIKATAVNARIESKSVIDEKVYKDKSRELVALMKENKYSTVITKVKFEILEKYGGAYCDMDVRILKDLDPLLVNTQSFLFLTRGIFYHLADCFFMQTVGFRKMNRSGSTEKLLTFLEEWGKTDWPTFQLYTYTISEIYIEHLEVRGWKRGLYGDYKVKTFQKSQLSVNRDSENVPQRRLPYQGIVYQV